jgi:hypothetical protein
MDVRLHLLGRLQLNDQIHIGDIQSSAGHISCDQHSELSFLKPPESDLSLTLCDVSMHHFQVFPSQRVREDQRVGVCLGLSEDDGLSGVAAIAYH